jgi:hypothetical protein
MPRFCTSRLPDGSRCTTRALPGKSLCCGHAHPGEWVFRPCGYFNRLGEPCRGWAIRGQDHCFVHSRRNRRAKALAVPLVPRTRRQRARAMWLLFKGLPQSSGRVLQAAPFQGFASVLTDRGEGVPHTRSVRHSGTA